MNDHSILRASRVWWRPLVLKETLVNLRSIFARAPEGALRQLALTALLFCALALSALLVVGCSEDKTASVVTASTAHDGGAGKLDAGLVPKNAPYVTAAGIGVSDLNLSAKFYEDALGLSFQYELPTPSWTEQVLQDVRGNSVVLMDFTRERNTKHNPVKLVFYVPDVAAAYQSVLDAGGTGVSAPAMFEGALVGLAYDPDQYTLELIENTSVPSPVLVAVGIGVSSLEESLAFYTDVMGLHYERDYSVPNYVEERELRSYLMKGLSVVLMHFADEQTVYRDVPAKIVFGTPDVVGLAKTIAAEDPAKLLSAPTPFGDSGLIVGIAKDLEGYLVEILQSVSGPSAASGMDAGR